MSKYNLFIDDLRMPQFAECIHSGVDPKLNWVIARSSEEAIKIVESRGMPARMALDHDLGKVGGELDTVPKFLYWLAYHYWNGSEPIPAYTIHSANSVGSANMKSFMESWKKSENL